MNKEYIYLKAIEPYFEKALGGDEEANEKMRQVQKEHFKKHYSNLNLPYL